jgi:hypothetical protein
MKKSATRRGLGRLGGFFFFPVRGFGLPRPPVFELELVLVVGGTPVGVSHRACYVLPDGLLVPVHVPTLNPREKVGLDSHNAWRRLPDVAARVDDGS